MTDNYEKICRFCRLVLIFIIVYAIVFAIVFTVETVKENINKTNEVIHEAETYLNQGYQLELNGHQYKTKKGAKEALEYYEGGRLGCKLIIEYDNEKQIISIIDLNR